MLTAVQHIFSLIAYACIRSKFNLPDKKFQYQRTGKETHPTNKGVKIMRILYIPWNPKDLLLKPIQLFGFYFLLDIATYDQQDFGYQFAMKFNVLVIKNIYINNIKMMFNTKCMVCFQFVNLILDKFDFVNIILIKSEFKVKSVFGMIKYWN